MITDDEVLRLFERADPARTDDAAPAIDAAGYLDALRARSNNMTYIDAVPMLTAPPTNRHRWLRAVAAAATVAIIAGGLVLAARDGDETAVGQSDSSPVTLLQETAPPPTAAPVAVTGRISCGPEVQQGTTERVVAPLADGEMTIDRARGFVWRQSTRSMSDPRLEGTVHQSEDLDSYTLPGGAAGPAFGVSTKRIENDEGAWQGSAVVLEYPDGTWVASPYVMVGEGAYEGLTAVYAVDIFACGEDIQGYILEGGIPAAPEPYNGE